MISIFKQDRSFYKTVFSIAIPVALQNLISFSLSIMDIFFLGFIGEREIAAVSFANAPFYVIMLMIFGFQSGSAVMISQYWGKKDLKTINKIIGISFLNAQIVALIASIITFLFPYQIMSFFTPDHDLRMLAAQYMKIVAFSYSISIFAQIYTGANRSMGNAKPGLFIAICTTVINMILNSILIFGLFGCPRLGVVGAAIGTLIARAAELVLSILYCIFNKNFRLNLKLALNLDKHIAKDYYKYAMPVVVAEALWGTGTSLYPAIFGSMSSSIVAAHSIGDTIGKMFNVIARGMGDAGCVIVGGKIGQDDFKDAISYARTLVAMTCSFSAVVAIILLVSSGFIVNIFNIPDTTKHVLLTFLVILIARMPLAAFNYMTIVGLLRAGGDAKVSMTIDLSCLWIFGILGSVILSRLSVPMYILFLPIFFDDFFKMIFAAKRLSSGNWINNITVGSLKSYSKQKEQ